MCPWARRNTSQHMLKAREQQVCHTLCSIVGYPLCDCDCVCVRMCCMCWCLCAIMLCGDTYRTMSSGTGSLGFFKRISHEAMPTNSCVHAQVQYCTCFSTPQKHSQCECAWHARNGHHQMHDAMQRPPFCTISRRAGLAPRLPQDRNNPQLYAGSRLQALSALPFF